MVDKAESSLPVVSESSCDSTQQLNDGSLKNKSNQSYRSMKRDLVVAISGAIVGALVAGGLAFMSDQMQEKIEKNRVKEDRVFTTTRDLFTQFGDVTQVIHSNKLNKNHWHTLNGLIELYKTIGEIEAADAVIRFKHCGYPGKNTPAERNAYFSELEIMRGRLKDVLENYDPDKSQKSKYFETVKGPKDCQKG